MELLDFTAIRDLLADYVVFPAARRLALGLTPLYDPDEVMILQRETNEALVFLSVAGDIDLKVPDDFFPAIKRVSRDGVLTGLELLSVSSSIKVLSLLRREVLKIGGSVPILAGIADGIPTLGDLQLKITNSIGSYGEVLDTANPILAGLRSQIKYAYRSVVQELESIVKSSVGVEALQDQVISLRGDRLVLQVKAEMRQKIPGIVLDVSNTGATLFIEPLSTVDLCNAWRELVLKENVEVKKVLLALSTMVKDLAGDINRGVCRTARIDFIFARARYSEKIGGVSLEIPADHPDEKMNDMSRDIRLLKARHPLLGEESVPIDFHIGPGWSVLVITGPNTGGKTVAMKTLGLLALMHQSGIKVPAEHGSHLPVFDGIYVDVGDHQSVQQSASTFGAHMRSVVDILSNSTSASLVLLDELGMSTDPEEGSALAKAILGHLSSRGITTVMTTHYRSVAAYAEVTPEMMNASVALDQDTLIPNYIITTGVPGKSYAMSIAAQIGLPDHIMEMARSLLISQHLEFEDWLNELQKGRDELRIGLKKIEDAWVEVDVLKSELNAQTKDMDSNREEMFREMRREMEGRFDDVRKKLRRADVALSWELNGPKERVAQEILEDAGVDFVEAREELEKLELETREGSGVADRPLPILGDIVDVRGLNLQGTVTDISLDAREVEVAVGDVRFRLESYRVSPALEHITKEHDKVSISHNVDLGTSAMELDLRGFRAEDALMMVEGFLDKALSGGLDSVRIIHGKGTGVLRRVVRTMLEDHPLAKSFSSDLPEKGGDGVTIVELM